ncbi:MAG: hypothetical protein R6X07_04810 [Desulfatiglandales bacterium]
MKPVIVLSMFRAGVLAVYFWVQIIHDVVQESRRRAWGEFA